MSGKSERELSQLFNDAVDAELGPRRPAPGFAPQSPIRRPRLVMRWLVPVAAAAAVAVVTVGVVIGVRWTSDDAPAHPQPAPTATVPVAPTPSIAPTGSVAPTTSVSPTAAVTTTARRSATMTSRQAPSPNVPGAVVTTFSSGAPPAGIPAIVDCVGDSAKMMPTTLTLGCSNDVASVDSLTWTGWGTSTATGVGVLTEKGCVPDCASGGIVHKAATVRLSEPGRVAGVLVYRVARLTVPGENWTALTLPLG